MRRVARWLTAFLQSDRVMVEIHRSVVLQHGAAAFLLTLSIVYLWYSACLIRAQGRAKP
jgi:hypothetical protein